MKKLLSTLLVPLFILALIGCDHQKDSDLVAEDYLLEFNTDAGTADYPLNEAQKFVLDMGLGWNLGNTFDAYGDGKTDLSTETCWGQPKTTKAMIDGLAEGGIKTIRIPVSWHNHFVDDNYTIDPAWISRVKEVVDWSLDAGLYVILNIHHDDAYYTEDPIVYNDGFYPMRKDEAESKRFLTAVWSQVGTTFSSYGEKLIFETMNEPRLRAGRNGEYPCESGNHEWWLNTSCSTCLEAEQLLLEYNQLCIDVIRSTGGKNATVRYISCPNFCCSPDAAFHYVDQAAKKTQIELLKDSVENHLIQAVHMYTPYDFAMEYPGQKDFKDESLDTLKYYFNKLFYFIEKGYPVIVGETGATNKNNLNARAKWYAAFTGFAKSISATCCIWDNGNTKEGSESYGFYDRSSQEFDYPLLLDIAVKQTELTTKTIYENMGL